MVYSIRKLNDGDSLEELTTLLHAAYRRLAVAGFNTTAVDQSVETTRARCAGGICFVAESEGRLLGSIKLNPPDVDSLAIEFRENGIGIINQFGVHPEFRGFGIGLAMHGAAETEARRLGYRALLLDTMDGADELVSLYEAWGYRIVGRVHWPGKNYESHIMRKELG